MTIMLLDGGDKTYNIFDTLKENLTFVKSRKTGGS